MVKHFPKLQIDGRSSAAYGMAHILAALTVTNKELKALALAEKDISLDQYEKMMELQRIKAKDEAGDPLEEAKVRLGFLISIGKVDFTMNNYFVTGRSR